MGKRQRGKRIFFLTMILLMAWILFGMQKQPVLAEEVKGEVILDSDRDSSRDTDKYMIVGVRGVLRASQMSSALSRLNQIRLEACKEGVRNPETGQKLTQSDYVALQWSSSMEWIARIRSAESSICRGHNRPNGDSWDMLELDGEHKSSGESQGWNSETDILNVINSWYDQKSAWTDTEWTYGNNTAIASDYVNIINPRYRFVGIGQFLNNTAEYYSTVVAEFSDETGLATTMQTKDVTCIQKIEIQRSYLGSTSNGSSITMAEGQTRKLYPEIRVTGANNKGTVLVTELNDWHTSDEKIVSLEDGVATARKIGTVTVKVTLENGKTMSFPVIVRKTLIPSSETPVTVTTNSAVTSGSAVTSSGAITSPGAVSGPAVVVTESNIGITLSQETFAYDGIDKEPTVVVTDTTKGGAVVDPSYYDVSYPEDCREVGIYRLTVTFKGAYTGKLEKSYTINPSACQYLTAIAKKKKIKVDWQNTSGIVTGFELQYSRDEFFSEASDPKILAPNVYSDTIKKLKKGKRYYVRVRCYKTLNNEKLYSEWATVRSGKVK